MVQTVYTGTVGRNHQVVNLVTGSTRTEYGEIEALVLEIQGDTIGELRNTRTQVYLISILIRREYNAPLGHLLTVFVNLLLTFIVKVGNISAIQCLTDILRINFLIANQFVCLLAIDTYILEATEEPDRVTSLKGGLHLMVETADTTLIVTGKEFVHRAYLILQRREVGIDAVLEVTDMVAPACLDIETSVQNLSRVKGNRTDTDLRIRLDVNQQVLGYLAVPVEADRQAVTEEAGIKTEVYLLSSLPGQVGVGSTVR